MAVSTQLRHHARLFDHMGKALGLDLQEEAIAGRLQFEEIAEGVLRCARCSAPGGCQRWLAQREVGEARSHGAAETVQGLQAPEYCRNADLFSYLQQVSQ